MPQRLERQECATEPLAQGRAPAGSAGGALAERVLALQRTAGNAAVGRQLASLRAPRTLARVTPGLFVPPTVGAPFLPAPGAAPPPLPGLPGGLGGLRWVTTAVGTAESVAGGTGVAAAGATTVVEGGVTVGGAALGPGAAVLSETARAATGVTATGEAAAVVGGLAIAPEATVVLAGTATATGTTAGAAGATGAALITPVGWIVIGVIVVGLAVGATVYLVMRSYDGETNATAPLAGSGRPGKGSMAPPRIAPGASEGSPVREPDAAPAVRAPAKGGMAPVREPLRAPPIAAPGVPSSGPLEAAGPLEGCHDVIVKDPRTGEVITDIDEIQDDTLWEKKSAISAEDIPEWVRVHIREKFGKYLRARAVPPLAPYYSDKPIGFHFERQPKKDLSKAIWAEIGRLQDAHPDVEIRVGWDE
jgi:hypothetical protein